MSDNIKHYGIIYKIICLVTPDKYIGKTKKSLEERWNGHKSDLKRFMTYVHQPGTKKRNFCTKLYNAMRAHGIENFKIELVCYAMSKQELDELETKMIQQYNTLSPNGYNLTTGGEGGWDHSPETKALISANTIKGIHANIDSLRTNKLSKGLPVHCVYTKLKGKYDAFLVQHHPRCNQKEFKFKDYNNSADEARIALLTFLEELERTNTIYYLPKRGGNKVPKGIRQIPNGYQVKKMHKGKRTIMDFNDVTKTDDQNLNEAKTYLENLIKSWQ